MEGKVVHSLPHPCFYSTWQTGIFFYKLTGSCKIDASYKLLVYSVKNLAGKISSGTNQNDALPMFFKAYKSHPACSVYTINWCIIYFHDSVQKTCSTNILILQSSSRRRPDDDWSISELSTVWALWPAFAHSDWNCLKCQKWSPFGVKAGESSIAPIQHHPRLFYC